MDTESTTPVGLNKVRCTWAMSFRFPSKAVADEALSKIEAVVGTLVADAHGEIVSTDHLFPVEKPVPADVSVVPSGNFEEFDFPESCQEFLSLVEEFGTDPSR